GGGQDDFLPQGLQPVSVGLRRPRGRGRGIRRKGLAASAGVFPRRGEPEGVAALLALRLLAGVLRVVLQPVAALRATDALHGNVLPSIMASGTFPVGSRRR